MELPIFTNLANPSAERLDSLARKMKRGDRKAAAVLYDELLPKVYGFFMARVRNQEVAEDLTHDIFVKLIEKVETFDPEKGRFTVWFWQVTRRYLIDYYRVKKEVPFSTFEDNDGDHVEEMGGSTEPADMEVRWEYRELRSFVASMNEHEKELFEMRFVAEMSYRDIAAVLGKAENTLRVEALRVKEKIKRHLKK